MKIAFFPKKEKNSNQYNIKIVEALKKAYPSIEIISFPKYPKILLGNIDFQAVWLNWYENLQTSPIKFFIFLLTKTCVILKLSIKVL